MNETIGKAVRLALRLEIPADYGKRRIRRLESALAREQSLVALSEIKYAELLAKYDQRGEIIASLVHQAGLDQNEIHRLNREIADLQYSLDTAVESAWANCNSVDFTFADRPMDGPEDYATAPISMAELRADLAQTEPEVLEGKVTQYNETTGRHDTVEIKRPVFVRQGQHDATDFMTPTYVPGMAKAS